MGIDAHQLGFENLHHGRFFLFINILTLYILSSILYVKTRFFSKSYSSLPTQYPLIILNIPFAAYSTLKATFGSLSSDFHFHLTASLFPFDITLPVSPGFYFASLSLSEQVFPDPVFLSLHLIYFSLAHSYKKIISTTLYFRKGQILISHSPLMRFYESQQWQVASFSHFPAGSLHSSYRT